MSYTQCILPIIGGVLSVDNLCSMYSVAMACLCCFHIQDGATPLFMASKNGHTETVELLLQNSATVNTPREVSLLCPCTNHHTSLVWMVDHLDTCVGNAYVCR